MTFQQLQYLLEVHNSGSISKAAENLFVSRPAVSLSISSLESELGYPIFIRTQNGLIPSAQGQSVIKYAANICQTYTQIKNINSKTQNLIKLSVVNLPPVNRAVVRLLDEYKERDDITFTITVNNGISAKDVALGNLDLALSAKIETVTKKANELIARWNLYSKELAQVPLGVCIGTGHRLYKKEHICFADLQNDPYLDTAARIWTASDLLKNVLGAKPKNVIGLIKNPDLKRDILQAGLAYTIQRMPQQGDIDEYGLRYIPLNGICQRLIYIIDPNKPQHEAVERFLSILDEELSKESYRKKPI